MSNLALTLRPDKLEDVLGNENVKQAIRSFAKREQWPNVFLFVGPPGTGKTTLALLVAKMCGAEGDGLLEVNASDDNGVDAARSLSDISASIPFLGKRRAIILNEFHSYTGPAQNALKDPMEKNPCVWILTTDKPDKVELAIKSRAAAATFNLKPLNKEEIWALINRATDKVDTTATTMFLLKHGITSPRDILGVVDQVLSGVPLEEVSFGDVHEPLYKDICGSALRGDWTKTASLLSQVKTADSRGLVSVLSSFLRTELVRSPIGPKADALSACLVGVDQTGFQDGVAYGAVCGLLYKTCKALRS